MSLEKFESKNVKITFKDNRIMTGYADEWISADESDDNEEELIVNPDGKEWQSVGAYIMVLPHRIKSIEVI